MQGHSNRPYITMAVPGMNGRTLKITR